MDLDELLTGEPTHDQVVEFFRSGEFYEEQYLVAAIKKHLRTDLEKQLMAQYDFSIEEMLNGRIEGRERQRLAYTIFEGWNAKLGFKHFGS